MSRKLKKADKALAVAEKAAAKSAKQLTKATVKRDNVAAKVQLGLAAAAAKDARKRDKKLRGSVLPIETPAAAAPTLVTVAQLREAARAKGVAGYSRMTRAQLLKALG